MTRSNIIDIEVYLYATTDRAVCVSATGDRKDAIWLPLSQIEIDPPANGMAGLATVTLPEPLALEKGLI